MAKKSYVLDTNVYLTDAHCFKKFGRNDIILPIKVLEEIDKHKKRQDGVGANARHAIRLLDELRARGNLHKGIRIGKGLGIIRAVSSDVSLLPSTMDRRDADNIIIAAALAEQKQSPNRKVAVVSLDINLRVRCDAIGLDCQDYSENQVIKEKASFYSGFMKHLVDDEEIDRFYAGDEIFIEQETTHVFPNQFVMLVSSLNEKKTALAMFIDYNKPLRKTTEYKRGIWGVTPRNKEQTFGLNLLLDSNIQVVSLVGQAGCGKTLLAVAAGLEQTIDLTGRTEPKYKKLLISRPIQPMGKDLGYLPGTMEDKMSPWIAPIKDNLLFLMDDDKDAMEMYFSKGVIDIEAITYIRGRSISNAFIIIDEAQNLTAHELKTIITRVGENTKIVLTGDVEQIDNIYLDARSNGLTHAFERLKPYGLAGHVKLVKGERSKVATLAAKVL
tara:strand:- start:1326 stop:2651 length:1326 start_codon:yes stop_codon:yes gene_type:complete